MNTEPKPKKLTVAEEFKRFMSRGSVVELGIAFVMGAAFKTVIDALAGDGKDNQGILGGLIGAIFGGDRPNFNDRGVTLNGSFIPLGSLLSAGINFLLVAVVLFFVIKAYGRFRKGEPEESTNSILASIRDELRKQN